MSVLLALLGPTLFVFWLRFHYHEFHTAWKSIDPAVAAICIFSLIVVPGVWKVRAWGYFAYLLLASVSLTYLLYDYVTSANLENYTPLLVATLFAIGTGAILQKHVTAPYFNPRLRWWERDPRHRIHLGVKFFVDRQTRAGHLLDISPGGCFTDLEAELRVGEEIEIRMQMIQFDFTMRAKVIWNSSNPKGYGLMFMGMTRRHRKEIDRIIAYLIETQNTRRQGIAA